MKKSIITAGVLLWACGLWAQGKPEKSSAFSIGGEAALNVGKPKSGNGVIFGGSLQQEFLVKKTGITLNLGYIYPNDYYNIEHQAWLMAGVRYYVTKNFFAAGQLGPSLVIGNDFAGAAFIFSPGIGVKYKPVDVSLYYRGTTTDGELLSTVGLRVGLVL